MGRRVVGWHHVVCICICLNIFVFVWIYLFLFEYICFSYLCISREGLGGLSLGWLPREKGNSAADLQPTLPAGEWGWHFFIFLPIRPWDPSDPSDHNHIIAQEQIRTCNQLSRLENEDDIFLIFLHIRPSDPSDPWSDPSDQAQCSCHCPWTTVDLQPTLPAGEWGCIF